MCVRLHLRRAVGMGGKWGILGGGGGVTLGLVLMGVKRGGGDRDEMELWGGGGNVL